MARSDGARAVEKSVVTHAEAGPATSVRAVIEALADPRAVWTAPDEPAVVAGGVAATLTAGGEDRFSTVRDRAEDLLATVEPPTPAARPRLLGGFSFHDDHAAAPPWNGFPGAWFLLPEVQVVVADDRTWVTAIRTDGDEDATERRLRQAVDRLREIAEPAPAGDPPGIESRRRTPAREEWRRGVRAAVDRIEAGDLRKVVLAGSLSATAADEIDYQGVLDRLGAAYPDCYRFALAPDGATFLGATPETLARRRGRRVETEALAGSTGRGDTEGEDEWLAAQLRDSEKDVHEHEMVAEAIREQLTSLSASVRAGDRRVRKLATVQHLETPITADLADAEHVLSVVEALHPTPAVGGLPPNAALETIRETEPFDRGWYAAPVGWFDAAGDGTFAVAIRSGLLEGREARLIAGAGVVADSDPDREWSEVQLKYRPLLDALE